MLLLRLDPLGKGSLSLALLLQSLLSSTSSYHSPFSFISSMTLSLHLPLSGGTLLIHSNFSIDNIVVIICVIYSFEKNVSWIANLLGGWFRTASVESDHFFLRGYLKKNVLETHLQTIIKLTERL